MQKYSRICLLFFPFCLFIFLSCEKDSPVQLPVDFASEIPLFAKSRAAAEGKIDFSAPQKLEYFFPDSFVFPPDSSFVFEYDFSILPSQTIRNNFYLVLDMGKVSWELPMDNYGVKYAVPIDDSFDGSFSITLEPQPGPKGEGSPLEESGKIEKDDAPVFQIRSLRLNERRFGFEKNTDGYNYYTPFVYMRDDNSYVIDVPPSFMPAGQPVEIYAVFSGNGALEYNGRRIETFSGARNIFISAYPYSGQVILSGDDVEVFKLNLLTETPVFPKPIAADPGLVLAWPKENWRNADYEVFCWERFRNILIFDFADFAAQDRMLKRLAFFVEKAGFRGRLARDEEIANLHGWNAHDYRAADLARFFDLARNNGFPLLREELELEKILLNEGIIREAAGGIVEGAGAIISISRESGYNRNMLMAHEGFHGLFFIDEDFREFSRRRWEQLPSAAKRFITSYFEYQQYDVKDEYLLVNEFMSYVLQQSVSGAAYYFGENIPSRLENTWRASALPQKDEASGTWPILASAFRAEAQAFSDYVNQRWALAAGRVWSLRAD